VKTTEMNNEGLQTVVIVIVVLVLLALALSPVVALWVYVIFQNGKRRKIRERILASHRDVIGDKRWFPVRYASEPRFNTWFKIFPWEGAGIMVVVIGSVLFLGETLSSTPITLQFAPGNARINWLGKCPWPNGAVSWLRFDTADQKHYFSSETGVFIFGSHKSTKALYDEANRCFGAPAARNL
jgi:hypothetical protein